MSKRFNVLLIIILALFYLIIYVPYLFQIPIFEDETFYTQWSTPTERNNSLKGPLSLGFSPLFPLITLQLTPFLENQITAGRIISLLSGFSLALVFFFTLRNLTKSNFSYFFAFEFILLPIVFVYSRMALLDMLMVLFSFISAVYAYKYQTSASIWNLVIYFLAATFALLTKQIAAIAVFSITLGYFALSPKLNKKNLLFLITNLASFIVVAAFFLPARNQSSFLLSEFVFLPKSVPDFYSHLKQNLHLTANWLTSYYSLFLLFLSLGGFLLIAFKSKKNKAALYFILVLSLFSLIQNVTAKLYFPRHTLFLAPLLLIPAAVAITEIAKKSKLVSIIFIIFLLTTTVIKTKALIDKPQDNSTYAKEDEFQLYQDWTSGVKMPQIADYIVSQTNDERAVVWTEPGHTLYYFGLPKYLKSYPNIEIKRLKNSPQPLSEIDKAKANYVIINRGEVNVPTELIQTEKQVEISDRHTVIIYQLK